MDGRDIKESLEILDNYYKVENEAVKNKLKLLINKTGSSLYNNQARTEFKLLLTVKKSN